MPTYDGTGTMVGNTGNGYIKITYIDDDSDDEEEGLFLFSAFRNPSKLFTDPLFYVALISIVFSLIVLNGLDLDNEKYNVAAICILASGIIELIIELIF